MKQFDDTLLMKFSLLLLISSTSGELIQSCLYPPCRYNVDRDVRDNGNIVVMDTSVHKIVWDWEVKGGKWNVTYLFTYPEEWYEGMATFINCSNVLNGKEQPFVSWGSSKNWESNAIPIYANTWNISYNGDVFGFIPTGYGKYIFRIFTRNKIHNPFKSERLVQPESCSLQSSDIPQVQMWWVDIKRKNCPESVFTLSWATKLGTWYVVYKWISETDKTYASIFYKKHGKKEDNTINWEIDDKGNSVGYKAYPVRIEGEPAWNIELNPSEHFGFSPTGQGKWIVQLFSNSVNVIRSKLEKRFEDLKTLPGTRSFHNYRPLECFGT